jgi:hypothetical protein
MEPTIRLDDVAKLSIHDFRTHVQTIIRNARASDLVMERMAGRGYTAEKLDALQALLDDFTGAARTFDDLRAQKDVAARQFAEAVDAFRRGPFRTHVDLASAAFIDDPDARTALHLDDGVGSLEPRFQSWLPQAADFYDRLSDPQFADALAAVHFTPEEIQEGAAELDRLAGLYEARDQLDANRQQARVNREDHRHTLQTELRRFQSLAKLVLNDQPQELESLGFTVPS